MSEVEWLVKKLKAAEDTVAELTERYERYECWWQEESAKVRKLEDEIAELKTILVLGKGEKID